MPFVFGYGRHSTNQQSVTEDVQKGKVWQYFQNELAPKGLVWGGWLYDGEESASKPLTERPEGLRLWAMVQPGDHVCWYKMDRAFRSSIDGARTLEMFKARRITVHSLDLRVDTSTPLGKFFQMMMLAVAELELDTLRLRTSEALQALKAQGRPYNGVCPMGYKHIAKTKGKKGTGRIEPCPVERKLCEEIHEQCKTNGHERVWWWILNRIESGEIRTKRKWQKKTISWALLALAYDFPLIFRFAELKEYARANPQLRNAAVRLPAPLSLKLYGDQSRSLGQAAPK